MPSIFDVWALNVLQNSIMFTPLCPRAGPTGGEGVAFPAGTRSFTSPITFFILYFLHLIEIQFYWCCSTEYSDKDLNLSLFRLHLVNHTGEICEGTFYNPYSFSLFKCKFRLWFQSSFFYLPLYLHNLFFIYIRNGIRVNLSFFELTTHKSYHLWYISYKMPAPVIKLHVD